tara:strand:+ start:1245 stop:2162 length:918 start_codon:yes stop_codon:yes gene_type:complete
MILQKLWLKIFNKKKYSKFKNERSVIFNKNLFDKNIKKRLQDIDLVLKDKKEISFLHSGNLGDIINSLPVIKEISKNKICNLFIEKNKLLPTQAQNLNHPLGKYYLTENSVNKILPLLKKQDYIKNVNIFNNQKIDINLNFFRELPINFNIDSVRWYFHITGVHADLNKPYLHNIENHAVKDKIIIIRTNRRKNYLINYNFLNNYDNTLFLGLEDEYNELKKEIPNLIFYECKDFLEMAQIIQSSKIFIGNLSFGYTLAEALKKPRLLESGPNFPLVYPNGSDAYDFYFQNHFENSFKKLYLKNN